MQFSNCVRSMEKMSWDGPAGRAVLFPANPDLANVLGDMDLDFLLNSKILDFQVPIFPNSQTSVPSFSGSKIPRLPGSQISQVSRFPGCLERVHMSRYGLI